MVCSVGPMCRVWIVTIAKIAKIAEYAAGEGARIQLGFVTYIVKQLHQGTEKVHQAQEKVHLVALFGR